MQLANTINWGSNTFYNLDQYEDKKRFISNNSCNNLYFTCDYFFLHLYIWVYKNLSTNNEIFSNPNSKLLFVYRKTMGKMGFYNTFLYRWICRNNKYFQLIFVGIFIIRDDWVTINELVLYFCCNIYRICKEME